ncbi:MAG: NAD(P)/FAD-dependent oxidoreductase [Roseovarius sp.]
MTDRYTARRFPVLPGRAAWNAILTDRFEAPPLAEDVTCDVAIIGAGFAGLAAARRLTQGDPSLRVVILDALPIGEGGIGRNSGFMIDLPHELTSDDYAGEGSGADKVTMRLNRRAIDFAGEAVESYGIDNSFFVRSGKINGAVTERGATANRSYARHLQELGESHRLIDAQEMQEITGSSRYRSGLYTPGTVMLQPAGYAHGMAKGLTHEGVRIFPETRVASFERRSGGWRIATVGGSVETGKIILATNGHLESFGFKRGRLIHLFLYAAMTEPMDAASEQKLGGARQWAITPADPAGTTMRRISDAHGRTRLITRAGISFRPSMRVADRDLRRAERIMRARFDFRFPQVAGYPNAHVWSGHLCLSNNGASVARELEDGVYAAAVQNGLGSTRGTLTGIAAAEQVLGKRSDVSDFFLSAPEPSRLPPEPFATLGARGLIRWKEWQAGQE